MLAVFLNKLGRETGFLGNIFHELSVIERNPQLVGHDMSDGTSAGAEFTADGDNFLFHNIAST